ncbi:TPA: tail fiber assembly protein [Salmonella enterica]|nr:tail fiber assembly protein [Salmonella enterica subsp. enterica serovar Bredeney]HAK8485169.1 tail fiber assembly protein [Salmonella enterica]HAK8655341.1 tail fiber assembly protein [Salmonella enterica]
MEPIQKSLGKRFISSGPLPENVTTISPDGQHEKWDGTKWVKDEAAEKAAQIQ